MNDITPLTAEELAESKEWAQQGFACRNDLYSRLHATIAALTDRAEQAERELSKLRTKSAERRKVLEELRRDARGLCPTCKAETGHIPGCALAAALREE